MRKTLISLLLITTLLISQSVVIVNASADVYTRVYVPLPYILSTYAGRMSEQDALHPASPGVTGKHIDLSSIPADRGVFSYVLYRLMYPYEQQPPEISAELKAKYGYDKYSDKRFEPVMKDYTIWCIESGYLSPVGKANHLLGVKWADTQSLLTVLKIQPAEVDDYSIYDYDDWGFVTDSEKSAIGTFLAAFGRGIDTRSFERQEFTLTVADLICLATAQTGIVAHDIDDGELFELTGYTFSSSQERPLSNGAILSVCFPHTQNDLNKAVISDLKIWAEKEGLLFYEN